MSEHRTAAQLRDEWKPTETDDGVLLCVGCDHAGYCLLGIRSIRDEPYGAQAFVECSELAAGGPGVAHGGWIAHVFDDLLGWIPTRQGLDVVTADLRIEFLKPVPVQTTLTVEIRDLGHVGRRWEIEGLMRIKGAEPVLASAKAILIQRRTGHSSK